MSIMLTVREAAEVSHIGVNRIRELARRRDFPALRVGRRILIHEEGFDAWLRQNCVDKISKRG